MYPFSKRTVMLATAAVVALPQAAVFAQEDVTYELIPVATQMSAIPSASTFEGEAGSIGEIMPESLAAAPTSADAVEITVTDVGKTSKESKALTDVNVAVYDADSGAFVTKGNTAGGKFSIAKDTLLTKKYFAKLTNGTISDEGEISGGSITVTTGTFTPKKTALAVTYKNLFVTENDPAVAANGVGAIKGYINGGTEVRVFNAKKEVWTAPVAENGLFKVYLPAGKYNVVAINAGADGRNVLYKNVTVTKGQASAPLQDMEGTVKYADDTARKVSLGLKDNVTLNPKDKKLSIKDTSFAGVTWTSVDSITFKLFDVTGSEAALLGTKVVNEKTAPKAGKSVDFTLSNVLPGKKLQIQAVDAAFNTATYNLAQVGNLSGGKNSGSTSSGDVLYTVDSTDNTVEREIEIGLKDNAKVSADKVLLSNLTEIKVGTKILDEAIGATRYDATKKKFVDAKGNEKTGDYIKASGKLIFAPGALNKGDSDPAVRTAGDKTIVIKATGFDDISITQPLNAGIASEESPARFTTTDGIIITAKDQYGNILKKGATVAFFMDITPSFTTTEDVIKIDGATFKKGTPNVTNKAVVAKKVGDDDVVKVPVDMTNFKTVGSNKVTVQVKVKVGTEYKNAGVVVIQH